MKIAAFQSHAIQKSSVSRLSPRIQRIGLEDFMKSDKQTGWQTSK